MDFFKAKVVIFLFKLLASLSLKNAQRLGRLIGSILWMGDSQSTRVTKENIELCFPTLSENEQQHLIKQSLIETGKTLAEFGLVWEWPTEKTLSLVRSVRGKHYLDDNN